MKFIYNTLFYLLLPFILIRLFWRSRKIPGNRNRILERFGIFHPPGFKHPLWIHAVSFGEAKLAITLIQALQKQEPDLQFVVTTMTVTGSQQISQITSDKIFHVYVPYDFPGAVKRFLEHTKPTLLINIETELWPNILEQCQQKKIPVLIINARLSEKSFHGYHRIKFFMQQVLKNVTEILAQTEEDAQRFIQLGAAKEKVTILGNFKFDVTPPQKLLAAGKELKMLIGQRPVLIAASTHPHEENLVLKAFLTIREKVPDMLLILVPRHPERFDEVAHLCQQQHFKIARRTENKKNFTEIDILLGDSMGELWLYYAASDLAFVGGSMINHGGHNLLEPALLGIPVISGNYYFNFKEIANLLLQNNALNITHNSEELAEIVIKLWQTPEMRQQQGQKAQQVVTQNQGALKKYCVKILGGY